MTDDEINAYLEAPAKRLVPVVTPLGVLRREVGADDRPPQPWIHYRKAKPGQGGMLGLRRETQFEGYRRRIASFFVRLAEPLLSRLESMRLNRRCPHSGVRRRDCTTCYERYRRP